MEETGLSLTDWIARNWDILTIPFVSAFIGWFTNWVALQMLFHPVEFKGIGVIGWRGIIPANAEKVAGTVVRLITQRLINLDDLLRSFTGQAFVQHADEAIDRITDEAMHDIATRYAPMMWASLGDDIKAQVRAAVRAEVQAAAVRILDDLARDVTKIIDLEHTVLTAIRRDKALLGRIFQKVGNRELRFIEESGAWFGFLFGIPMMWIWTLWPSWWLLPVAGFAVGYATNWLALKMIFEPQQPMKLGPIVIQGLFHKRQQEVADAFAQIVADQVITADNIIASVTSGRGRDTVGEIIAKHLTEIIGRYQQQPMVAMALKAANIEAERLHAELHLRIFDGLHQPGGLLYVFADKAVDVRDELFTRMAALDARSFEGVLRPAFQQDEWKLILAGGVLGLLAGWAQAAWVFGDQLAEIAQATTQLVP